MLLNKFLISFALFIISLSSAQAQAVFTPPVQPNAGTPAKLSLTGTGISCVVTGNQPGANSLTFAWVIGANTITPYAVPFTVTGTAYTVQMNYNGHAITVIANMMNSNIVNVTGTIDGGTAVGGNF